MQYGINDRLNCQLVTTRKLSRSAPWLGARDVLARQGEQFARAYR
jgi:hypothetical protein